MKAEFEPDSISPSYLGEILDDMVDEHPDRLSHISIAGAPDRVTVSVGTQDHSVSGTLPAVTDQFAGIMSAAMKRKLDKAAVPEYVEFDGFADSVTVKKMSVSFGSSEDGCKVVFVRELNTFLLCHGLPDPDDDEASGYNNWADGDDFGAFSENGRVPYAKTLYLDRSTGIAYRLADDGLRLVSIGAGKVASLAVDDDAEDVENIHIKAFDVQGKESSDVAIPNSEIRRRVVFFDGMLHLAAGQMILDPMTKAPHSSDTAGFKVYYYMHSFLLTKGEFLGDALRSWSDWKDAVAFMDLNSESAAERKKPYYDRIYIDRSTGLIYIRKNAAGDLLQLGSRFASLTLDASDKRNYIVKALDADGGTIASVSIPKPAKAPESPAKILAKDICRPTSDPRYAYRLHNNPNHTVIYRLPDKLADEQLKLRYMPECGPNITVFDVSNLLDFDSSNYGQTYFWTTDYLKTVDI